MKSEFESRISFQTNYIGKKRYYYATAYWKGVLYETTKYRKGDCIADLKRQANAE